MNESDRFLFGAPGSARPQRSAAVAADVPPERDAGGGLLKFGERQLRDFEKSPRPMRIFDRETLGYLAVNDAAVALYGYSREEFLTLTVKDTRHPDEHEDLLESFDKPEGYLLHFEPRRHLKKAGEVFVAEVVTQDILFEGRRARVSLTIDITERVRVLDLLQQREQEFEALVAHAPDIISRVDRNFRHLYVNPAIFAATGHPPEEFIGRTIAEIGLPADLLARWHATLTAAFSTGREQNLECVYHGPNGPKYYESRIVPERDAHGAMETVLVITRDITERKQAEEELQRQKKLLTAIIDNLPVGIFIKDAETLRLVMVNRASSIWIKHPKEAVIGKTPHELFPADQAAAFSKTDRQVLESGQMMEIPEQEVSGRSGKSIIQHVRKVPLFDEEGKPWVVVGIADDITERKRVENALRESNELLRSVIESSRDCIKVLDLEGRLLSISTGGQRLMEIGDVSSVLGRSYPDFFSGGDRDAACAALAAARAGDAARFEGYCPTTTGVPKWWDEIVTPMVGKDGRPEKLLVVSRDITENRRAEQTLRDSEARFELAVENTGLGMWDWNVRTGEVWRHPRWARILGYEPDEVPARMHLWQEYCHPEDWPHAQEKLLAHFEGKTPVYRSHYRMRHKRGTWIWIGCRGKVIERDADGTPLRMVGFIRDISERKMMEEALRETQEQFRAVTETANDAIVSADNRGIIVYFNQAAAKIFGYSVAEAIGEPLTLLMPERFRSAHREGLRKFLEGNPGSMVGKTLELVGRCKDGTEFPVELSLASWRTNSGVFFTGIVRDLTNRKRREALQSSLAAIVNNSADAIISQDLDGIIRTWNPGAESLFGYQADEVIGQSVMILIPFDRRAGESLILERIRRGERTEHFESVRRKKDGALVDVSLTISPVKDIAGSVFGASTIVRDITERKRAESALRESEERFRQLAENIEEVFWINTPAGDGIIYVSPAYEEIWGRSCESLYRNSRSWMEPIHPDDLPAVRDAQKKMPRGEHTDVEYRIVRPDGTQRWIRDRSYPMRRGDGTLLHCGIAEDITIQKQAEQERITHAIYQRDALVREVHHRIKNHLQGIAGLLRNKAADDPAATDTIEAAVAQLQSVAVVYGLQSEVAESGVPLCRVLEAICSSAEGLSGARVVRAFAAATGSIRLAATEAVPVAVALNELVFNAIKHGIRRGGTSRIEVALAEKKDGADIRIVNRGKLSARFDYSRGIGTGTGLDLVKTLLGPSGGKLQFGAREGRVEVNLSLRPPLVAARKRQAPTTESHPGK